MSGLLHDCKSNIERMVERVPQSDYDQLHHFISESPWDSFAVMASVSEQVEATLSTNDSGPDLGICKGLLLDESGWEKSGKKSVGVARQYIGQVGKVANGQVGVFAALCNGEQVGLLQGRLYLPQEWVDDKARCTKAGIPEEEQIYRTKPAFAVEILKTLSPKVRYDWVERAFQNVKEQLGLHQYQVRSWKAWHHHIALSLMALHFMLQIQKENQAEMPLLSIPDIKLVFAKKLLNKLHSDEGLLNALNRRHAKRKSDLDKFSKLPK